MTRIEYSRYVTTEAVTTVKELLPATDEMETGLENMGAYFVR